MKKYLCLFITGILCLSVYCTDVRQVLFGNNYETIKELDEKVFFEEQSDIKSYVENIEFADFKIVEHDNMNYFRVFEQIAGDKRFIHVVRGVKPLTDEYITEWRNPDKIQSHTYHAYLKQLFYLPEGENPVAILPECMMDAGGYAWENGTDSKYEMVEIIQRNGKVKGFLFNQLVDKIDHHSRAEQGGKQTEEYQNTAKYYLFDDVLKNATKESGKIKYVNRYSAIPYVAIEASQPLVDSKRPFMYTLQNAFDGNPATAYVENTINDYVGIEFEFQSDRVIKEIHLINGYSASEKLYFDNNQIKKIELYGLYEKLDILENNELKQVLSFQTINLKDNSTLAYLYVSSGNELYKGYKYSDTCLAEIDLIDNLDNSFLGE